MKTSVMRSWTSATALFGAVLAMPMGAAPEASSRTENMARVHDILTHLSAGISAQDRFHGAALLADRRSGEIILFAEATGLPAQSTAEFILIGPQSGHAYEALAISLAAPSEICRAIEFLGVPRGEPVFARPMAFWPRGERVRIMVRREDADPATEIPLESLVLDVRHNAPLCAGPGLIYCGSRWTPEGLCAADADSPGAVVSTYNEATTVFDMPYQAPQSEVYERFVAHPDHATFAEGELLRLRLIPEPRPADRPRVLPLVIRFASTRSAKPHATAATEGSLTAIAATVEGLPADIAHPEGNTPADVLRIVRTLVDHDFDPYVAFSFADNLTVAQAHALSQILQPFDAPSGLRADSPPPGQLFYRAFNPPDAWRQRAERPAQPLELHVHRTPDSQQPQIRLVEILEHWQDGKLRPELEPVPTDGITVDTIEATLAERPSRIPVILVFAPPDALLADFMPLLRRVQDTHPAIHVFRGEPEE